MVDSDVDGGPNRPEVPDFAEMRRSMERDNRRHVLDGVGCLRPSCGGTLEHQGEAVRCTVCDARILLRANQRRHAVGRGPNGRRSPSDG